MSNLSLTGNPGTSLNFDGAELQNLQEAECRKEEEQQQNEVSRILDVIATDKAFFFHLKNADIFLISE